MARAYEASIAFLSMHDKYIHVEPTSAILACLILGSRCFGDYALYKFLRALSFFSWRSSPLRNATIHS